MPQRGIHKRSARVLGRNGDTRTCGWPSRQEFCVAKLCRILGCMKYHHHDQHPLKGGPNKKFKPAGAINPILAPRFALYHAPTGHYTNTTYIFKIHILT